MGMGKKLKLEPKQLQSILQIEGSRGLEVPNLGYVEVHLGIPEVKAFDQDILLLIVPDSTHTQSTPNTLGTLHIDMAIKLATEEELRNLNKQWQRCLFATKLTMKEAQVLDIEEAQIVSRLDSNVKLVRDITLGPFETIKMKGILRKTPNHYKRMNVEVNDIGERRTYKDIAVAHQLQILKPGSERIPMVLQNLSGRNLTLKKGTNVTHVEASQVVPLFDDPLERGDVCEGITENITKRSQSKDLNKEKGKRVITILEKLDLTGIKSWTEQQQCSVKKLLEEYQHLFALNLKELGKTSLLQHEIRLSNNTPFKERYRRIPPHQYEEVRKHLQEMLDIGAIHRSTSPWASSVVLVCKKHGSLQFCIDLRKLNNQTITDAQSLPRIEDFLDCLDGATIFTSLDLQSGYWQVEMTEDSKPLTAFTLGPLGFYECVQMPFGLTNALATFQHLMETCLGEIHLQWCIIYLDDIIVFSKTLEGHIERLKGIFEKLAAEGLRKAYLRN